MVILFLLLVIFFVCLIAAIVLAMYLKQRLVKGGNKYPVIISITTSFFTFAVVICSIFYIILANIRLER